MNLRDRTRQWVDLLTHVMTQPREELNRWQYAVRFSYELGVHGYKALQRDDAPQMAAALSFRTLFALLPVVVVSAVLVNAMQGPEQFKQIVHWVIASTGLENVTMAVSEAVAEGATETVEKPLGIWLEGIVDDIASLRLAALGWIGMAVLIYSAISLMVTIENSFNAIYGAPEGRSWTKRILIYWFVLTLGPLFLGLTLVLDNQITNTIGGVEGWKWLLAGAQQLWGFCVAWLFMIAMYRLVPNTRVMMHAVLVGALVAAIFLQAGKGLLSAYFGNAVSLGNIYGTLGAVPVFMFWVYLMWLVVLFGLEVAATIQRVHGLHLIELQELKEKQPQSGLVDPASVVTVMELITERFLQGKSVTMREIADETVIAESMLGKIIDRLARAGYLHRVEGQEGAVSLARLPDQICAENLIEIGYELVDEGGAGRQSNLVMRLREAQKRLASQMTLASLLDARRQAPATNQAAGT